MTTELIPQGYYRARAVKHDDAFAHFGRTKTGNQQVLVMFELTEGDAAGRRLSWFGFFSDASWERTIESLRHCGFVGDDLATLNRQQLDREVSVKIEHNTNPNSGKIYERVAFINELGGGLKLADPMTGNELQDFAAMMKARMAGSGHGGNGAQRPVAAPDPLAGLDIPPPSDKDDFGF